MISQYPPNYPVLKRWMAFVDGENLTIRAQKLLQDAGAPPIEGAYWQKDCFIWKPGTNGAHRLAPDEELEPTAIRAYYYTTVTGDDLAIQQLRERLWGLQFTPRVFKKYNQSRKTKGVDISLTRDMLSHAFNNHYDVGILVGGDGDYVPLVEELKHLGKRITVAFFSETAGLNPELKLNADRFVDITDGFVNAWKNLEQRK